MRHQGRDHAGRPHAEQGPRAELPQVHWSEDGLGHYIVYGVWRKACQLHDSVPPHVSECFVRGDFLTCLFCLTNVHS